MEVMGESTAIIRVDDLHFTYKKGQGEILKGINVEIAKGEIFGFLGPSGAGKSTLQKVLLGLLKGYSGSSKVMGYETNKIKADFYNKIGVGFELPNLYEQLTLEENLKTFAGLYENPGDIEALLEEVGLYPHRHKKVNEISKGMKMRLNFCRALVGQPELLFLDEPTSGLDPNNTKVIQDKILEYKAKGKTVVLTTHNMNFAEEICDRVAFVVAGQIKEIGQPEALRRKHGAYKVKVTLDKEEKLFEMEGLNQNKDFIDSLAKCKSIDTVKPSLSEIFTQVTGKILV